MGDRTGNPPQNSPRAEELIVTILAEKKRRTEEGAVVSRVLLSPEQYRVIQDYRARLGDAPAASIEYLTRYDIFGLEICVEGSRSADASPEVE